MTLKSSDLQSDSDLDSIRKSCDVWYWLLESDIWFEKHIVPHCTWTFWCWNWTCCKAALFVFVFVFDLSLSSSLSMSFSSTLSLYLSWCWNWTCGRAPLLARSGRLQLLLCLSELMYVTWFLKVVNMVTMMVMTNGHWPWYDGDDYDGDDNSCNDDRDVVMYVTTNCRSPPTISLVWSLK